VHTVKKENLTSLTKEMHARQKVSCNSLMRPSSPRILATPLLTTPTPVILFPVFSGTSFFLAGAVFRVAASRIGDRSSCVDRGERGAAASRGNRIEFPRTIAASD